MLWTCIAAALGATPFQLGGGARANLGLEAGFGTDLVAPTYAGSPGRRSTYQALRVRVDAVLVPALALTVEASGTNARTDLTGLVDEERFIARHRTGQLFVGIGSQFGNEDLEFQLGVGPLVGSLGYSARSFSSLVENGLAPIPMPLDLGGRTRLRARGQPVARFAIEARGGLDVIRTLTRRQYVQPSRRGEEPPPAQPAQTTLLLSSTLEGQVLLGSNLWITLGARLDHDRGSQTFENVGSVVSWRHQVVGQLGVRWR